MTTTGERVAAPEGMRWATGGGSPMGDCNSLHLARGTIYGTLCGRFGPHTPSDPPKGHRICGSCARIAKARVMAWVKPFAAFKRNVPVAYAWEPVIVKAVRKPVVSGRVVMRDYIAEGITMKRGLAGAKPEAVCHWCFEVVGAERDDELDDIYPGSGAVSRAWDAWRSQLPLEAAA